MKFFIRFNITFSFLVMLFNNTKAQNEIYYPLNINSLYTSGHIVKHSKDVSHMSRGFTNGFDIIASNLVPIHSKLIDRQQNAFIDIGFHFIDYPLDYEGKSFALTFGRSGKLLGINKFSLVGQFTHGLGYSTRPYSKENNKNNAISTHIGFQIHANLTGSYPIYNNWDAIVSLGYSHLSNGSMRLPNLGYNVLSTNIGIAYHIKDKPLAQSFDHDIDSHKYYYHLTGAYFHTASDSYSEEKYPAYSFHTQIERNISLHHSLLLGLDYNYTKIANYPEEEKTEDSGNNEANYLGLSLGASWKYSIIDFTVSKGIYLVKPWNEDRLTYNQIHFKIYVLQNKYIIAGLKAHGVCAKIFETGIGIRL